MGTHPNQSGSPHVEAPLSQPKRRDDATIHTHNAKAEMELATASIIG